MCMSSIAPVQPSAERACAAELAGSRQTAGMPDEELQGATESPAQSEAVNQAAPGVSNKGDMPHSQLMHPHVRPLPCTEGHV